MGISLQPSLLNTYTVAGVDLIISWRRYYSQIIILLIFISQFPNFAQADSPELVMREFSSGQIKKGVRSMGFGGDGATFGNYGLVWKDAGTTLADYGNTGFTNGNDFKFEALGYASPALWHDLVIYVIAMDAQSNNVNFNNKSPGLGSVAVPVVGSGSDHALFTKIAMPLGNGFSAGVLLSYENSDFQTSEVANSNLSVNYKTLWRPSGGFGVTWQPNPTTLLGFRALLNNDVEQRTDTTGLAQGAASSSEYRLGGSVVPWEGALIDIGGTRLERSRSLDASYTTAYHPNLGFEQKIPSSAFTVRMGIDETSPTIGMSYKYAPFNLDVAYVNNMSDARVGNLFGTASNSLVMTLTARY